MAGKVTGTMPDITAAQIAVPVGALAGVIATVNQAPERLQLPIVIGVFVLGAIWLVCDALLRGKRTEIKTSENQVAVAQLQHLIARPEGDDSIVPPAPTPIIQPPAA